MLKGFLSVPCQALSRGYVVVQYNKRENVAGNALDDIVSVGNDEWCSTRHHTHIEPSNPELSDII